MTALENHELFEIEALERLKNANFLKPLVFAGGTMLRLCYELNRYSTDLDFWFTRKVNQKAYFTELKNYLGRFYELTDAKMKFNTSLFELRSRNYPKRLKIEIRRKIRKCDCEERIAFSKHSTKQVILRVHTLQQMLKNKIEAALERKDIRDFFDMEFLLRRGISMPNLTKDKTGKLRKIISGFKEKDYKVTLGSVLEPDTRRYYIKNKFSYLLNKLVC